MSELSAIRRNVNGDTFWEPEHDAALREFFAANLSYAEIAAAINAKHGTSFSRNACIGRANRIGLRSASQPKPKIVSVKPKRQHKFRAPKIAQPTLTREEITLRCAEVTPLNLTLFELEPGQCRYPYGDGPQYLFCAHPQTDNSSYCFEHFMLTTGTGTYSERAAHRGIAA